MPSYVTPKKNTEYVTYISLVSQANVKIFQANPTLAAGDVKVATDDGVPGNITTLPVVDADFTKRLKVTLAAAEMNGDNISVIFSDAAGAEWCDLTLNIQTSVRQVDDAALASVCSETRLAELDAANVPTDLSNILTESQSHPTLAEMEATTILAKQAKLDTLHDTRIPGVIQPQTGDSFARLGAPAGASVSADIAVIKTKTDNLPDGIPKNTALNNFEFFMVDSTDHVTAKTGLTITSTRSIDGGTFVATANSASEISSGVYKINLAAADLNGDIITFRFTATGADDRLITIKTEL